MTDLVDSPARPGGRARALLRTEGPAAARILVTVAAAWQAALWLGADQPPVFAAIVPLVALRGDPMTALGTSLQRILGVVAGVLIAIAVLNLWQPSTLTLTLVVALGLGVGMVLRAGGALNIQVALSSLLVFANASPDSYALDRVWETAAGAAVTILLAPLLWPPDPQRVLTAVSADCGARLSRSLTGTAAVLGGGQAAAQDNLARVHAHVEAVHAGAARAREAERALRFNPLRRRQRGSVRLRAGRIAGADGLAAHVATLAGEVAAFTGREDLAPDLARARLRVPELASLTARAVELALSGDDPRAAVTAAREGLAAYARADSRPVAVALRRPLHRVLDELEVPPTEDQRPTYG
ncbi:FUSC family protein [Streptomyces sp. NBC_00335]|uniref:FUSC family protein n=1 Tax=unclassified Streptomyces TaxID=2593676 RepID=UPI0022590D9B|nr:MULTISPECIES: FUSC family protein [unclassified Streptomyces]MCX5409545.1 FUSC family protein [Streptomyces sp. NBC_00086]